MNVYRTIGHLVQRCFTTLRALIQSYKISDTDSVAKSSAIIYIRVKPRLCLMVCGISRAILNVSVDVNR